MAILEISTEWIITSACVAVSSVIGLYTKSLKADINAINEQRKEDLAANEKEHDSLKFELSDQRKTLTENHDAVIRLIAVAERLDQTLNDLKKTMENRVSVKECELLMNRRETDKK